MAKGCTRTSVFIKLPSLIIVTPKQTLAWMGRAPGRWAVVAKDGVDVAQRHTYRCA